MYVRSIHPHIYLRSKYSHCGRELLLNHQDILIELQGLYCILHGLCHFHNRQNCMAQNKIQGISNHLASIINHQSSQCIKANL